MEQFDLYDPFGNKLDKTMTRGERNNPGEYHLVTHIWIRNSKNQYLIQQRNKTTDDIPYQWAPTGGAVSMGETSREASVREVHEELGIRLDPQDLVLLKRYKNDDPFANFFTDLYLVEKDIDLDDVTLDETEVRSVAYKTMDEIKQMIRNNEFWDQKFRAQRPGYFEILETSLR